MSRVSEMSDHRKRSGANDQPARVFLVDDDHLFREGLRRLLEDESEVEVVGEAATPEAALDGIIRSDVDVALLDVKLPGTSGIELCRELRSRRPGLACLMLSGISDEEAIFLAVMAGASGFLPKSVRPAELVATLRRVAAGETYVDRQIADQLVARARDRADDAPGSGSGPGDDDPLSQLNPREREVLDLVAEGLTNREIAERVHLAEKTVKNYLTRILDAFDMERRTQVIVHMADIRARRRFTS